MDRTSLFVPARTARAAATADVAIDIDPQFAAYWNENGGLAQQGFPLAAAFTETNPTDGKTYKTQYFERARFEYHPEYPDTPVLLGLLGREQFMAKYPDRPINPDPSSYQIPSLFQDYWNRNGGLAQQGYPISDAFMETNPTNGQQYLTQYFERARFEHHPKNADPKYKVLLGLLGREQFMAKYPNGAPETGSGGNWRKEFSDPEKRITIYNESPGYGFEDNTTNPTRNFQAIVDAAKKYFPDEQFSYHFLGTPEAIINAFQKAEASGLQPKWGTDVNWSGYGDGKIGKEFILQQGKKYEDFLYFPNVKNPPLNQLRELNKSATSTILRFIKFKGQIPTGNVQEPEGWPQQVSLPQIVAPWKEGNADYALQYKS